MQSPVVQGAPPGEAGARVVGFGGVFHPRSGGNRRRREREEEERKSTAGFNWAERIREGPGG